MRQKGFTLIEMIIVIGVFALVLPAVFAIVFGILKEQTKIYALKQAKREGDFVLNHVESLIRNYAVTIHSDVPDDTNIICDTASSSSSVSPMYFEDKYGHWFYYGLSSGVVASNSSILNATTNLTTSKVTFSNFNISCDNKSSFNPPIVSISFTVCYGTLCTSSRAEETASFDYQTKIKLRND